MRWPSVRRVVECLCLLHWPGPLARGPGPYNARIAGRARLANTSGAALRFCPEALRWGVGGETMTTPGGAGTTLANTRSHFPCSAHRFLSWGRSSHEPGSGPSLCPGPMLQGVSYVQISGLGAYIRNIIPIRAPAGLSRVQSKPLPGRARNPIPPPDRTFFHPTSGKKNSRKFAVARSRSSTARSRPQGTPRPLGRRPCPHHRHTRIVDSLQALTGCCIRTSREMLWPRTPMSFVEFNPTPWRLELRSWPIGVGRCAVTRLPANFVELFFCQLRCNV
jgi:hypothetical protein